MTRKIWATLEAMPFSDETLAAAEGVGAGEIIQLPCPALPQLIEGYNTINDDAAHVPQEVTMRQAQLQLHRAGLLSTVEAAIAGMSGDAGIEARIEWSKSGAVQRNKPLTVALGAALSLTSAQLDDLFIAAALIP